MDSSGDKEDLVDGTSTFTFPLESLDRERPRSDVLLSGPSSESTAVSAGEFSLLSPVTMVSESTRVRPLAPEIMEEDLSRWFAVRVEASKRSVDGGDSDEDTRFVGGTLISISISTGGEVMESSEGEELGSVEGSGELEPLALRGRLVRRFGLASSATWEES